MYDTSKSGLLRKLTYPSRMCKGRKFLDGYIFSCPDFIKIPVLIFRQIYSVFYHLYFINST